MTQVPNPSPMSEERLIDIGRFLAECETEPYTQAWRQIVAELRNEVNRLRAPVAAGEVRAAIDGLHRQAQSAVVWHNTGEGWEHRGPQIKVEDTAEFKLADLLTTLSVKLAQVEAERARGDAFFNDMAALAPAARAEQEELKTKFFDLRSQLTAAQSRIAELSGALEWLWSDWLKDESESDPGVFHASTDHDNQVRHYACVGCDAEASSCWPTWHLDFKHSPDCKVAKVRTALKGT